MDFHKNGIHTVEVAAATPSPIHFLFRGSNEKNSSCEKIRGGADALFSVRVTHPNA